MRKLLLLGAFLLLSIAQPARAQFCPGVSPWVFDDVQASDPFCGYITWMAQNGISLGCQVIDANHRLYCPSGTVSRAAMAAFMNRLGNIRVEAVGTGPGLTGGPITSVGTINLASTQLLPTTACAANQIARWNGSGWVCSSDANSGGTVTSVGSGTGLTGGPITASGTLSLAAGFQLPQGCASGQVAKSNGVGSWSCASDAIGTGTVTSITAGNGLTGGTITTSGTIAVDPASAALTGNFFRQNGNAFGTTAVVGTTDGNALDVRVNGARVMRFEPNGITPNVVGGHAANFATAGVRGATIGGGGIPVGDTDPNYPLEGPNRVTDNFGTVGGGYNNQAGDNAGAFGDRPFATVGGGIANTASGDTAFVGGGALNLASGPYGTVAGGNSNQATGPYATVAGGAGNIATRDFSAVGGGGNNQATGYGALIGGGANNVGPADYATIGGGYQNRIDAWFGAIFAGRGHAIHVGADYAMIGGGWGNVVGGNYSTISGGTSNTIGDGAGYSVIGGGIYNVADGDSSTVGGGWLNKAHNFKSTVAGGYTNTAGYDYSFVGGGRDNLSNGYGSVVAGGANNNALGITSQAGGWYANANADGCYVWGDFSTSNTISCNAANRYVVRSLGGVFFFAGGSTQATYTGVVLPPGATAWVAGSDRNTKENVTAVEPRDVLERVAAMPISTWNLKAQDASIRHMGPMAQDFRAAFGLGETDVGISTIDADGVALAAIQGLNAKLESKVAEQERELASERAARESLAREVTELRRAVEVLLARTSPEGRIATR